MKQFAAFVRKEFYHIMRDYRTLLVLFGMPIAQILLFGFALSNEVKNTRIAILDLSADDLSIPLADQLDASKYFDITSHLEDYSQIDRTLRSGDAKMVVVIPQNFSGTLHHSNSVEIQLITDGTNPNMANTIVHYAGIIIRDFQKESFGQDDLPYTIEIITRMMYNPQLKGEYTFVPGVIALVLMLVCAMMTSVSIVKEKELGNMEILLVSPMHPLTVILSKAVPYLILSIIILTVILLMSVFILHVPIKGSLILVYFVSLVFIITALSIGLLISTITSSQQVAMMISLMGLMLPTMMLSGFMFPIESMPLPLRLASNILPSKWYFFSIEEVMIKGLGLRSVIKEVGIMAVFAVFFLGLSFKNFKMQLS